MRVLWNSWRHLVFCEAAQPDIAATSVTSHRDGVSLFRSFYGDRKCFAEFFLAVNVFLWQMHSWGRATRGDDVKTMTSKARERARRGDTAVVRRLRDLRESLPFLFQPTFMTTLTSERSTSWSRRSYVTIRRLWCRRTDCRRRGWVNAKRTLSFGQRTPSPLITDLCFRGWRPPSSSPPVFRRLPFAPSEFSPLTHDRRCHATDRCWRKGCVAKPCKKRDRRPAIHHRTCADESPAECFECGPRPVNCSLANQWKARDLREVATGLGTRIFCGLTVKVWPFSEVVWPQMFCSAFWPFLGIFEYFAEFRPNLYVVPHSGI